MKNFIFSFLLLASVSCVKNQESKPEAAKAAPIVLEEVCDHSKVADNLKDPQNIQDVVELINALPKPLKLNCLIQSLKRPLQINATSSILSAQPAEGKGNPRIFILKGNMFLSVVPTGDGAKFLEISEFRSVMRTTKAEIKFPIEDTIADSAPYQRIWDGARTSCSGCHRSEMEDHQIDGVKVYSSAAFKPAPANNIGIEDIHNELYSCDFQKSGTDRCLFYRSLFNYGEVSEVEFPDGMQTFFGSFTP